MISIYTLISVLLISLISFAGVFALVLKRDLLNKSIFVLVSLAVGALLGDVFVHIIPEMYEEAANPTMISFMVIAGILLFFILEKVLHWHHHHSSDHEGENFLPVGRMVLVSDGVHNFIDGVIIAASYLVSIEVGVATTIAVVLHEIPQEIGNFGVLIHAGYTRAKALWYNFLSALTAIAGAAIVLLVGGITEQFAFWLLPITAGSFIYIAMADLIPELHKTKNLGHGAVQVIVMVIGVIAMAALLALEA
ncbi:MAG TPA: ZIP family metal transporter [Candidatus Paceibacterota bacterium]